MLMLTALFSFSTLCSANLSNIKLPQGFQIEYFAQNVEGARSMVMSPSGVLYVGTRQSNVYAIRNGRKYTIATGLNMPNGVAFKDGDLYVAEISRITVYKDIERSLESPPAVEVLYQKYPRETHHGWKYIAFGPDGWLYVPVGAPCNVCVKKEEIFSTLTRLNVKSLKREIMAHGVRNSVGFDWHPETKKLWFTDNGRDWLGDDKPPCELNHLKKKGTHFGFPYCHGKNILDPDFGKNKKCSHYQAPALELEAHVAPLGMTFYTGKQFPKKYHGGIFIPEHGSWNRSKKIGYRIRFAKLKGDKIVSYKDFATGWLQPGEKVLGRPVQSLILKDGSMLVSDDHAGVIYRISYGKSSL